MHTGDWDMALTESIPAAFAGCLLALSQLQLGNASALPALILYFIGGGSWIEFCIINIRDTGTL